ncbi:Uncharacterised protein [Bordetella pertussis]|nr:Uncharacterised protein [Bordetella pertussis]
MRRDARQFAPELGLDARQRGGRVAFEAQRQDRGAACLADQAEAVVVVHAHAVQVRDAPRAREAAAHLHGRQDGLQVRLGQRHPRLGRRERRRRLRQQRRRIGHAREQLQHARGRIDRIVEAVPAVLEIQAPAHFAGQQRAGLLHARLDLPRPGFPDQRLAARLLDAARGQAAALDVVDHRCARAPRQHVARQQHQQPIGPDDFAALGHHRQAVAVAVERQAHFAVRIAQAIDQVLQVARVARVGGMVGRPRVAVGEQRRHLAAQLAQQVRRIQAGDAVAAVQRHLERAAQPDVGQQPRLIAGQHGQLPARARRLGRVDGAVGLDHGLAQLAQSGAVQRGAMHHDLETAVGLPVAPACHGHARAGLGQAGGVVHHGRGDPPDVDDVRAGGAYARLQRRRQRDAAQRGVAPDHHRARMRGHGAPSERQAERVGESGIDLLACAAADIVGPEDPGAGSRAVPVERSVHGGRIHKDFARIMAVAGSGAPAAVAALHRVLPSPPLRQTDYAGGSAGPVSLSSRRPGTSPRLTAA